MLLIDIVLFWQSLTAYFKWYLPHFVLESYFVQYVTISTVATIGRKAGDINSMSQIPKWIAPLLRCKNCVQSIKHTLCQIAPKKDASRTTLQSLSHLCECKLGNI